MFSPIKSLITYIQKNASGNSIFGGNIAATEVSAKMETENIKEDQTNPNIQTESEVVEKIDKEENIASNSQAEMCEETKDSGSEAKDSEADYTAAKTTEDFFEHEDIETKIESNIMMKNQNTLKVKTTNSRELLELEKASIANHSIAVSQSSGALSQISDELDDFMHDPMEGLEPTSYSYCDQFADEFCSVGSTEEAVQKDFKSLEDLTTEDEIDDHKTDDRTQVMHDSDVEVEEEKDIETENEIDVNKQAEESQVIVDSNLEAEEQKDIETEDEKDDNKTVDSDLEVEEEKDIETEGEIDDNKTDEQPQVIIDSDIEVEEEKDIETENEPNNLNEVEEEEEPFLDLDTYKERTVIVLDEVDLNASTPSVDTNNTTDDPLAIACEEQEAFAADKTAVLEELNLLNNSQTSQDEDTRTTTDEELRWLKSDLEHNLPSCSSHCLTDDNNSKVLPEKEERNGEGSDSGLGSETSALHITTSSIADTSQLDMTIATTAQTPNQINSEKVLNSEELRFINSPTKDPLKPFRSNLKRRFSEHDNVTEVLDSTQSTTSSLDGSIQKKPKRSINFDTVKVYYFPRQQGFSCVPSAGGCTLGMGANHIDFKTLTLAEHAAELRRAHRMQLQEINPRGSSSEDSEESEEDYLSEGSGSDLDGESNGFLQPVSPKQRRALLKAAGIRKIDPSEKAECRNIRNSREVCGCTCRDFCDPETCACSQSGIKCQVDRDMFPCGCSRDACGNTIGRVEFNPTRVRTHYIHTLMRLEMENRQQQNPYSSVVASTMQPTPSLYYQTHLQPQSNYSSGYASPAYNTASEMHQQTAASSYYHTQTPSTSNSLYSEPTSLELTHNGGANPTSATTHYGIDSLDSSLFGGSTPATPSYGELMAVGPYHYGNLQTQATSYNSYHNAPYSNVNSTTNSLSTSNTYSSCAVPSIPPFGAATTTEATGVYHSVNSLSSLETTTAPSCNINGTTSLENDASTSFISLSTPLASSSRLSQINDLLQHNRNATTALVAVSPNIDDTFNQSASAAESLTVTDVTDIQTNSSSLCSNVNMPPIEDTHKSCMTFEELDSPLKSTHFVSDSGDCHSSETEKPLTLLETVTDVAKESPSLLKTEFLPQTSLSADDKEAPSLVTASVNVEPSTIEVAAGN